MSKSLIEWTDETLNPFLGCTKCSPGCKHCYAINVCGRELTESHRGLAVLSPVPNWNGNLRFEPDRLQNLLTRETPKRWFINSLSDFFHEDTPTQWQRVSLEAMKLADWHVFQILTKRERQLHRLLNSELSEYAQMAHVLWGVSVEDKKHGLPRIDALRRSRAKLKWLSVEPLLEDLGVIDLTGIDWVVVGGESGKHARPMKKDWVKSIQHQCRDAGVKFFFKQWGQWGPKSRKSPLGKTHRWPDGTQSVFHKSKKDAGRRLNGRTYDAAPTIHTAEFPGRREKRERVRKLSEILSDIKVLETPLK